jgi:tetratricopeptide (TPR) repeat protein
VAYNTLSRRDRKARHLAAVRFFEGLGSDELAGALAGHYLAAQRNATPGSEADALAAQARIALRVAAERASALGSLEQAVAFIDQALTVTTDPPEQAELLERKGWALSLQQRFDDAESVYREALPLYEASGDRVAVIRTTAALADTLIRAFRFEAVFALVEPASAGLGDLRNHPVGIELDGQLARVCFLADANERAVELSDRVLQAAEQEELAPVVAHALITKGSALINLGRRYEGIGLLEAGRRLAESHGRPLIQFRALINLSAFLLPDEPRAALEAGQQGLAIARRLGTRSWQIVENVADASLRIGHWDRVEAEMVAASQDETDPVARASPLTRLIELRAYRGEDFEALVGELRGLLAEPPSPVERAFLETAAAMVALRDGRLGVARAALREVVAVAPEYAWWGVGLGAHLAVWLGEPAAARDDLTELEGKRWRGRAVVNTRLTIRSGIAGLEGRTDEALASYREALRTWRDLGLQWDEALMIIDLATVLDPREPEVATAIDAARESLQRLGARPFLERLEAAAAGARGVVTPVGGSPTG